MNIKSLLLGSAAALVAVSGARAADAIVAAEPEPVEFVRVCDAFGTGFFYIPGTETCLRIHGYIRYDVGAGELFETNAGTTGQQTYFKRARANVRLSTATETELGTLRTYSEVSFQRDTNTRTNAAWLANNPARIGTANGYTVDSETTLDHAWISLGGVLVGYTDSLNERWTSFAGPVINDGNVFAASVGGTNQINYTYDNGAFSAAISLEQGADYNTVAYTPVGGVVLTAAQTNVTSNWGIDDYMPHVVVGLGYKMGMVNLRGTLAYDTRDLPTQGGWAGKLRADVTVNDQLSLMAMIVYGENTSAYTTWGNGAGTEETFGAVIGGSFRMTEKATFNFEGKWRESNTVGQSDAWGAVANVAYTVVPGLIVTPEFVYNDMGTAAGGQFGFYGRVQRSF